MTRRPIGARRGTAVCLLALACGSSAVPAAATAPPSGAGSTPAGAVAYQLNTKHDGHIADPLFDSVPALQWSTDLLGPVHYPLIVDGKVFVDVGHVTEDGGYDYGSSVSAYDLESGDLVWGPVDIGGTYQFGAIAYDGGRVFALNHDGDLYALDAETGFVHWSTHLTGSFTSPPTASNGVVYTGGSGTLYAVDGDTGGTLWTAHVMYGDSSSPAVSRRGVFVSYACEQAYRFSAAGDEIWHHETSCAGGGGRTGVLHAGKVFIRDDAVRRPAVLSQQTGRIRGQFESDTAPAFSGDTMVTLADNTITATDLRSGDVVWSRDDAPYVTAPLIVNGYVVEGDGRGRVHLLELSDGSEVWVGKAGAQIYGPDEHNANGLTGLAAAEGHLVVPAGSTLSVFAGTG